MENMEIIKPVLDWLLNQAAAVVVCAGWILQLSLTNKALRKDLKEANKQILTMAGAVAETNLTLQNIHLTFQSLLRRR